VERAYPSAERVEVFPSVLDPLAWRYAAVLGGAQGEHVLGNARLFGAVTEERRSPRPREADVHRLAALSPTLAEALAWARFPSVRETLRAGGARAVEVADLRYHLRGEPTLRFVVELDGEGRVTRAELDRGGSVRDVLGRMRGGT
jgi:inner membrane protein